MIRWPWRRSEHNRQSPHPSGGDPQEVLIICDSRQPEAMAVVDNLCAGLEFANIPFSLLDLRLRKALPALERFQAVALLTETGARLDDEDVKRLRRHVRGGAGLLVGLRCRDARMNDLFGLPEDAAVAPLHETSGLIFKAELFPGIAGLKLSEDDHVFEHACFAIDAARLGPQCEIVATDLRGNPIAWTRAFGAGRVAYWNTGVLFARVLRGIALHSLFATMPVAVAAIAGFAMLHVDDYPPSLSDHAAEPVAGEFAGLDWNGYFFKVWIDDMMALKDRHDLAYTFYAVMNYGDVETRPEADPASPGVMAGKEVLAERFRRLPALDADVEFGFHGYNHEPLTDRAWPDPATLEAKLKLARAWWREVVSAAAPTSFVPANNWYQRDHLHVLRRVFPEITSICGLFSMGNFAFGEYREFGPEPWATSLLCLPRETYGYVLTPEQRLRVLSQIAAMGMWTHFLHADDVYDTPGDDAPAARVRNPQTRLWRSRNADGRPGLLAELEAWITWVRKRFPWLEFVRASEAETRLRAHLRNRVTVLLSDAHIDIRCSSPALFQIRTGDGITLHPVRGGRLVARSRATRGVVHVVECAAGRNLFEKKKAA